TSCMIDARSRPEIWAAAYCIDQRFLTPPGRRESDLATQARCSRSAAANWSCPPPGPAAQDMRAPAIQFCQSWLRHADVARQDCHFYATDDCVSAIGLLLQMWQ